MDDEELERLLAELNASCTAAYAAEARRMLESIDETQPMEIGDQQCILLGFEGNVDAVWSVPERPEILKRPLQRRPLVSMYLDPMEPTFRVAEYRRVGEFTYQRER